MKVPLKYGSTMAFFNRTFSPGKVTFIVPYYKTKYSLRKLFI